MCARYGEAFGEGYWLALVQSLRYSQITFLDVMYRNRGSVWLNVFNGAVYLGLSQN